MNIRTNKLATIYGNTLISIILFFSTFLFNDMDYQQYIRTFGIIVIVQLIVTTITYKIVGMRLFTLSGIFTYLNYLFHFGQPMVKVVAPEYDFDFDASLFVLESVYVESLRYSLLIVMFLSLGIIFFNVFMKKQDVTYSLGKTQNKLSNLKQKDIFKIGVIIFIPTFLVEAYIQISRLITAINSGYLAIFDFEIGGVLGFIATFSVVGVVMMILGSKNNSKRGTVIVILYTIFYLGMMFSGGRMWQIIKIILIYYYYIEVYEIKFTKTNIILIFIIGYFGAGFLGAVAQFRSYDFTSEGYILQVFRSVIQENPLFDIMDEFGGTIYTLSLTIDQTPDIIQYSWGRQFLTNFFSVLPNLNSTITQINNNSNYVLLLKMPTIGGSFIGEIYYSFHYLGAALVFLFGIFVQYVTVMISRGIKNNDYTFIINSIMFQYSLISWVRGSSPVFYRNTIFSLICIYIITNLLIRNKKSANHSIMSKQ